MAWDSTLYPHEHKVRGIGIGLFIPGIASRFPALPGPAPRNPVFQWVDYYLYSSWFYQTNKFTTTFDPSDSTKKVTVNESYYYDNPAHIEMTRVEVSKSTGEKYHVLMTYPKDIDPSFAQNASPVVEKRVMINNGTTDRMANASITTYNNAPGALPAAFYTLKITGIRDASTVPQYNGTVNNTYYEKRTDFSYNATNDIISVIKESVLPSSYHWGYNDQYPVAECKNAANDEFFSENFEEASSVQTTGGHTGHNYYSGSYTTINKLAPGYHSRSYVLSYWYTNGGGQWIYSGEQTYTGQTLSGNIDDICIYPKDAQMTTYTYDPLVGMTSATDAKGETTYYEYDSFQRLLNIKDKDGNIIKHMDYHYHNQ